MTNSRRTSRGPE